MLVFGSLWRRRFISKFAVANPSTCVRDVSLDSQDDRTEQNYRDGERHGRSGPFDWHSDSKRTQGCEGVENPNEILSAVHVFVEPRSPGLVSHRQNTVVTLLAEFVNRPC